MDERDSSAVHPLPPEHRHGPVTEEGAARHDRFVASLIHVIHWAVRALAVLMVFVIIMGVVDVVWVLYQRLVAPPFLLLEISDILGTFGAFMGVLIAIEIFINITIYLRDDVIHIRIVMATALIAIARKVIILDMKEVSMHEMLGLAAVTLAMSIGYWVVEGNVFLPRRRGGDRS
ncbi:MAG: phosphate-starvation-inducible PsiE family protein [Phycisphaerae bacterium]|nr:phosphate-starvation-inducible PsiE family protein [Phycisphaerae bacterium]